MLTEEMLRSVLVDKVAGLNIKNLESETRFSDIGIDSLDMMMILLELDERYGIQISDEDIAKCVSLKTLLEFAK